MEGEGETINPISQEMAGITDSFAEFKDTESRKYTIFALSNNRKGGEINPMICTHLSPKGVVTKVDLLAGGDQQQLDYVITQVDLEYNKPGKPDLFDKSFCQKEHIIGKHATMINREQSLAMYMPKTLHKSMSDSQHLTASIPKDLVDFYGIQDHLEKTYLKIFELAYQEQKEVQLKDYGFSQEQCISTLKKVWAASREQEIAKLKTFSVPLDKYQPYIRLMRIKTLAAGHVSALEQLPGNVLEMDGNGKILSSPSELSFLQHKISVVVALESMHYLKEGIPPKAQRDLSLVNHMKLIETRAQIAIKNYNLEFKKPEATGILEYAPNSQGGMFAKIMKLLDTVEITTGLNKVDLSSLIKTGKKEPDYFSNKQDLIDFPTKAILKRNRNRIVLKERSKSANL